jgi:hypothetical protein
MAGTVRVTGLRETRKAFEKGSDELKGFEEELKRIAEPVARDVSHRLGKYDSRSAGGVKVRRHGFEVSVRQTLRKTTGKRGDYGSLQMREAFLPALSQHEPEVNREVEQWLDRIFDKSDL